MIVRQELRIKDDLVFVAREYGCIPVQREFMQPDQQGYRYPCSSRMPVLLTLTSAYNLLKEKVFVIPCANAYTLVQQDHTYS